MIAQRDTLWREREKSIGLPDVSHGSLATLLRLRWRLARNAILSGERRTMTKVAVVALLGGLFATGDYLFFRRLFVYFNDLPLEVGEILIIQLLNALCLMFFSMLIFSNVVASISTLYLSRDLDLLIPAPIPICTLFIAKSIHTTINSSWMAALFALPVFIAYGELYRAPIWYYPMLPLSLIPFFAIPSAIGISITMSLMRYFPARRTYQILSFIGVTFIGGLVITLRFLRPEKYLGQKVPDELVIDFVETMKTPDSMWLPSATLARALQVSAVADWELCLWYLGSLTLMAVVVSAGAIWWANKIYYAGWSAGSDAPNRSGPEGERLIYRLFRKLLLKLQTPPDMRAILMKDIKLFWRETGQWSQLFMLGALVVVYIFNIRNLPIDSFHLRNIVSVMNIGLAGVVLAAVAARFVFSTTSVEGKSFWAVHSAPINFRRFLWAKFFLYLAPLLLLAEALVSISNYFLGVDAFVMSISAVAIAMLTLGLTGLGVGMGAMYPQFDYENVAEIGVSTGAIGYMIVSLGYAGAMAICAARPVYVHLGQTLLGRDFSGPTLYASYAAIIMLTLLFVFVPMRLGERALRRMET